MYPSARAEGSHASMPPRPWLAVQTEVAVAGAVASWTEPGGSGESHCNAQVSAQVSAETERSLSQQASSDLRETSATGEVRRVLNLDLDGNEVNYNSLESVEAEKIWKASIGDGLENVDAETIWRASMGDHEAAQEVLRQQRSRPSTPSGVVDVSAALG